jgi:hypothetical protein
MSRPASSPSGTQAEPAPGGRIFWVAAAVGGAVVVFGLYGLYTHLAASRRGDFAKWFLGADLLNDLVIIPLACTVGYLVTRLVRPPWRFPLEAGLFATAVVLAVGWVPLHHYGGAARGNPSVQPLDYTSAVATVLAVVWATVAAWTIAAALRRANDRRQAGRG